MHAVKDKLDKFKSQPRIELYMETDIREALASSTLS